jgi:hypothetical protein
VRQVCHQRHVQVGWLGALRLARGPPLDVHRARPAHARAVWGAAMM